MLLSLSVLIMLSIPPAEMFSLLLNLLLISSIILSLQRRINARSSVVLGLGVFLSSLFLWFECVGEIKDSRFVFAICIYCKILRKSYWRVSTAVVPTVI